MDLVTTENRCCAAGCSAVATRVPRLTVRFRRGPVLPLLLPVFKCCDTHAGHPEINRYIAHSKTSVQALDQRMVERFGRVHEPKRTTIAWHPIAVLVAIGGAS